MEQTIRRLIALVPALALVAGMAAVVRPTTPAGDRISKVCVYGGEISWCLPRDIDPSG